MVIKEGDNRNAILATLIKKDKAIKLFKCTVYISIEDKVYEEPCTITDAEKGEVFFPLNTEVTNESGVFHYEFIVKYPDGKKETIPNEDYLKLLIKKEVKGR